MTQPAGKGATVEYRFRNGHLLELTAHEIKVEKLLDDVKAYLKSKPARTDWKRPVPWVFRRLFLWEPLISETSVQKRPYPKNTRTDTFSSTPPPLR